MTIVEALHGMPLAVALRGVPWLYPTVETAHIACIALLFGSIAVLDLRLLGFSRALPVRGLSRHVLPLTVLAFLGAGLTGSLLFLAHAADLVGNRVFILKLGIITLAGINAAIFHTGPYARAADWDAGVAPPPGARLCAALSLALWLAVIACGRWIAYV